MTVAAAAVTCTDLTVRRGKREAVRNVSFTLDAGRWLAVIGRNGSGKSTLLLTLAGLLRRQSGQAEVRGALETVLQNTALDKLLTVRENAMLFARLRGVAAEQAAARIASLAGSLGVEDRLNDRVGSLSGGLARRADLLRACVTGPEILLLDEPTAGLDETARRGFLESVRLLRDAGRTTLVWATHDDAEARAADHVAVLDDGERAAFEPPEALAARAADRIVLSVSGEPDRTGAAGPLREAAERAVAEGRTVRLRPISLLESALEPSFR
ncbi:MAG: ABC transporter ATP-binding protein [Planctomycetota bacterium]